MIRSAITKECILTLTPEIAFKHARLGKGPFKAGEPIISTDAKYSYWYAKYVLRGRFPLGEIAIATDPKIDQLYQTNVIERDFAAEDQIEAEMKAILGL